MNTDRMRKLIVILPIVSLLVAGSIVTHQYVRKATLAHNLAVANRDYVKLENQLTSTKVKVSRHHDDHDDHDH